MTTGKRTIAFVTNTRSDYSTMFPVMKAALADAAINALIWCGGMHLRLEFGDTWKQLEADGLPIHEKIDYFTGIDSAIGLADSLGRGVSAFARAIEKHKPDIVVVSGDRIENLALFSAATAFGQSMAHMCGGDITEGAFDNQVRHAMTMMSHVHFVSMEAHAKRVIQMGEEPWRVHVTGDAALDTLSGFTPLGREELFTQAGIPVQGGLALSTFHPQTLGSENFIAQYENILAVIAELPLVPVLSYPNIDPGHAELIAMLEDFKNRRPDAVLCKSFTREQYYSLLAHASVMVGNSSSGLWEAPSFALPVVNVGGRQAGRLRAGNVIDVSGNDRNELQNAVEKALSKPFRASLAGIKNPYGEGYASKKILAVLKNLPLDEKLMVKKWNEVRA